MADNIGGAEVTRNLKNIVDSINEIGATSKSIDADLRNLQKHLRLDPSNPELYAQKQELLAQKLKLTEQNSADLSIVVEELNRKKRENEEMTDWEIRQHPKLQEQLKDTERAVIALTGATKEQGQANEDTALSTQTFTKSMTEFQSTLKIVNQVTRSTGAAMKLFGVDQASVTRQQNELNKKLKDGLITQNQYNEAMHGVNKKQALNNYLQKTQQLIQITMGLASAMKLASAFSWNLKSALTLGAATAIAVASIAAITSASNKMSRDLGTGGVSGSVGSTPSISTPTVPVASGQTSVNTVNIENINISSNGELQFTMDEFERELNRRFANKYLGLGY